jgi:hypothetical protein
MKTVRIGSGAGFAGDRIEPAIDLMDNGKLDYIIFECLAERTIALAQLQMQKDPEKGYNELFEFRMVRILEALKRRRVKVITNMGAANPRAAMRKAVEIARELGVSGIRFAAVMGDDVLNRIADIEGQTAMETGRPLSVLKASIVSANAYIGVEGIVKALEDGADIIITGRVADPSLTLAALVHEFGWAMDDYDRLGKGTMAGHLLECAGQVTGGYFCDPGYKEVERLWDLGFPIAEVTEEGDIVITKLESSGGVVNEATCREQIDYEIHDPENYFTPDCTADFSRVATEQVGKDRVRISGVTGKESNGFFKVSVGYKDCYIGEGQISYGGSTARARALLAAEIIEKRLALSHCQYDEIRMDAIGVDSLYRQTISEQIQAAPPVEVRLRVVARTKEKMDAERIGNEVEALYVCGPAGGGGVVKSVREIVSVASVLIPKEKVRLTCEFMEV